MKETIQNIKWLAILTDNRKTNTNGHRKIKTRKKDNKTTKENR